jgi:hypothetical protein
MIFSLISNLIFLLAIIQNAYAYIDPGTANIIVQIIIGSIVSFLFMIKLYWNKIKRLFGREKSDSSHNIHDVNK